MARNSGGTRGDARESTLRGSGNRGGQLQTEIPLWGKGGKGTIVLLVMLAGPRSSRWRRPPRTDRTSPQARGLTYVEPGLLDRATRQSATRCST